MKILDVMTKAVDLGSPDMDLHEAARMMRDGDYGVLPIAENDRLVGMVTDRDIVTRAVAEGRDPDDTEVNEIMSEHVYYCFEDQDADEVADNMGENQLRRLPVLNRQKKLVGIVSLGDLALKKAARNVNDALCDISRKEHRDSSVHHQI